jgi:hypothetical protein
MKIAKFAVPLALLVAHLSAVARGVTPYLPLSLEPEIESEIERLLILAGKPVMRRPIAAATVLEALPKACAIDQELCERVNRYLARYTHTSDLTHASLAGASQHGADTILPDRYGLHNRSAWDASLAGYLQPSDYLLINVAGVAYDGRESFTGSYMSAGFSKAQLDFGYKPHWLSPMTDSSMLMSSEAPTMPSVGVSNYEQLTRLGLSYDLWVARMSYSNHILFNNALSGGYPRLAGIQLNIEPVSGWSLGVNRLVQFGGGPRGGGSFSQILRAIFYPSRYSNQNPNLSSDQKATNQEASVTSSVTFPGKLPFSVYAEYAGEDTSRSKNYLLGNSALSVGIHFPRLWRRFDLTLEGSEWQNAWYVHSVWQDGMTNDRLVVSNWFGDERVFGDGVGGRSAMARLGWNPSFGGQLYLRYRTLQNQVYGAIPYERFHQTTLGYSHPWKGFILGGELDNGQDVFGRTFSRVAGFVRYDDNSQSFGARQDSSEGGADVASEAGTELFLTAGVNAYRVRYDLTDRATRTMGRSESGTHFAIGARRPVTDHSDLGVRVDVDDIAGHNVTGFRLVDYRYRFDSPWALGAFLGAVRYNLGTPAYGFYYGANLEWRNVLPGWDLGAEVFLPDSVARDHLLPSDPHSTRVDSFYDVYGLRLLVTWHY